MEGGGEKEIRRRRRSEGAERDKTNVKREVGVAEGLYIGDVIAKTRASVSLVS